MRLRITQKDKFCNQTDMALEHGMPPGGSAQMTQ